MADRTMTERDESGEAHCIVTASITIDRSAPQAARLGRPSEKSGSMPANLDADVDARLAQSETLEQAGGVLLELLTGGHSVWPDGTLYNARAFVGRIGHMRIEIRLKEHPPPHFHVVAGNVSASFAIEDGAFLRGRISGRDRSLVERWYPGARSVLVEKWNETRPSDCPVGPIR